jgi:hypothetical protein
MPNEDVHHLLQNSTKESIMVLIDSSKRDMISFPNPNEYVVEFEKPYNNVCGVQILDAAIPRTMYVVDNNTNTLVFFYGTSLPAVSYGVDDLINRIAWIPASVCTKLSVTINPGDYSVDELIDELNSVLNVSPFYILVSGQTTTVNITMKLRFTSTVSSFVFDTCESTCGEIIGISSVTNHSDTLAGLYSNVDNLSPVPDPLFYTDPTLYNTAARMFEQSTTLIRRLYGSVQQLSTTNNISLADSGIDESDDIVTSSLSENPIAFRHIISNELSNVFYTPTHVVVLIQFVGTTNQINFTMNPAISTSVDEDYPDDLNPVYSGSMDVAHVLVEDSTLITDLDTSFLQTDSISYIASIITANPGNTYAIAVALISDAPFFKSSSTPYWLLMYDNLNSGTMSVVMGSVITEADNPTTITMIKLANQAWSSVVNTVNNARNVSSTTTFVYQKNSHVLNSPGLVSLVGERYTVLRCAEIDQHVQMGYSFLNTSPGLALFKLGIIGYTDTRFDFSSIKYTEFHPIAKLTRLTFRFERSDGYLYDFKGINHHMLLAISFHSPSPNASKPIEYSLNPNYQPDYLVYTPTQDIGCDNEVDDTKSDATEIKNTESDTSSSSDDDTSSSEDDIAVSRRARKW